MPKKLSDVKAGIIEEARREVFENGYDALTIRNVAKRCGIATGTIYNYFKNKDELVAAFILQDWKPRMKELTERVSDVIDALETAGLIYAVLLEFEHEFTPVFAAKKARAKIMEDSSIVRHDMLVKLFSDMLFDKLPVVASGDRRFRADFIADALIRWSARDLPWETLECVINDLTKTSL